MTSRATRRGLLALGGAGAVVGVAGCATEESRRPERRSGGAGDGGSSVVEPVPAHGDTQAGITRPGRPQPALVSVVFDVDAAPGPLLARLGAAVLAMTTERIEGIAPADLTVTVGVGPRLVAAVDPALPGATELPEYRREEVRDGERGGDLWVQVCATDPLVAAMATESVRATLAGDVRERWSQTAWRGAYEPTPEGGEAGRNVQGFLDGIVAPRTEEELAEGVWLAEPSSCAGGTIAVVRRFRIDVAGWRRLDLAEQEAAVGRRRDSSVPLSGPGEVNLTAKSPDGRYLIPADAHVRRAHPAAVGVPKMLRRSYSISDPDPGLLFISFQSTLRAFTATMQQLEESDRMLDFATTTATGTFLVLPGFAADRPLGSTLF